VDGRAHGGASARGRRSGVSIRRGATTFTRTPRGAPSIAALRARPIAACLLAVYGTTAGLARSPARELVTTTAPGLAVEGVSRGAKRAMVWCRHVRSPSWQDGGMERVLGIGGYFMRAADPAALGAWYRDCLGLDAEENGLWRQEAGPTVFATFESGTDYFGSRTQQSMLNFRVRDLDAMLAQLRAKGADVSKETQDMEGVGRFGWVTDPEGNRVELWQPV
jgi:predicted enzyme related to lactoylglutathione lyase